MAPNLSYHSKKEDAYQLSSTFRWRESNEMIALDSETGLETMPLYKYQSCPGDNEEKMEWVR
jgi:hypothetical protein